MQTSARLEQAPASATPAPAGAVAVPATPVAPVGPISAEQAAFLRVRRDALSSQLESVQGRRDDVAEKLRDSETQAAERPGLVDRLEVLDARLIQIEKEIAVNSEQLANAPARQSRQDGDQGTVAGSSARSGGFLNRANPNALTFFSFLLLLPVVVRLSRRYLAPRSGPSPRELAELAAMKERMEKMDSAIDAVAVEVERIGEGQRFLTQSLTANLRRPDGSSGSPAPVMEPVAVRLREASELR
jgi:hypothetical protein